MELPDGGSRTLEKLPFPLQFSLPEGAEGSSCLSHLSNKDLLQGHSAFFLPWQPGCLGLRAKGSLARPRQGTAFHPGFLAVPRLTPGTGRTVPAPQVTSILPHPALSTASLQLLQPPEQGDSWCGWRGRQGMDQAGGMPWREGCQQERTSNIPPCWKCSLA